MAKKIWKREFACFSIASAEKDPKMNKWIRRYAWHPNRMRIKKEEYPEIRCIHCQEFQVLNDGRAVNARRIFKFLCCQCKTKIIKLGRQCGKNQLTRAWIEKAKAHDEAYK